MNAHLTAACLSLVLVSTASAQAVRLPDNWCLTRPTHTGEAMIAGTCPINGDCDLPEIRDGYTPDASTPFKVVRMHIFVLREDDGSDPAATEQDVIDQMARMNEDFAPYRIAFEYTWAYLDDSDYRHGGNFSEMKDLYASYPEIRCNVYVSDLGGAFGHFPWSGTALTSAGGIVIGQDYFGGHTSVLSHEMGHNLGLWHTHHGIEEVDTCSVCYEMPGSTDDTIGDFCGDTPPTTVNWSCDDPVDPDPCFALPFIGTMVENYMSYGEPCWTMFTPQQAARMHCWFEAVLTPWLVCEGADNDGDDLADPCCVGDGDGDGVVGVEDFLDLLAAWGTGDPAYDLDGDGTVGVGDFLALLAAWGPCP